MQALPPSPAARADGRPLPSVAVVGEALVDRFVDAERAGGAPFNLARALAGFGLDVAFVTRLGVDDAGAATVRASARRFGLCESGFQLDDTRPTGEVQVIESGPEHRFRVQPGSAWEAIELDPARRQLQSRAPAVLCVGTLAQRGDASRDTVTTLLRESAALRFLDVNLRPGHDDRSITERALHLADWVKVNEDELAFLLVWFAPRCDPAAPRDSDERTRGIRQLIDRFGIESLIVTRGGDGYEAWNAAGRCVASGDGIAVRRMEDSVGAGDAFSAALIAAHLAGRSWPQALSLANRYAAAVCAERGPVPDDDEFFSAWRWTLGLHAPHPLVA